MQFNYVLEGDVDVELADINKKPESKSTTEDDRKVKNYFKTILHGSTDMQHCHNDGDVNIEEDAEVAHLFGQIQQKQKKLNITATFERLSPNRSVMEKIAAEYQKRQADSVNRNRAKVTKAILEVGDVGSIKVQGNTRGATDHPWLPIMVTFVRLVSENNYMYTLCTQHGYLTGEFVRGDIYPNEHITAEILKINPMKPNFMTNLTVAKASQYYNALGGATFCKC